MNRIIYFLLFGTFHCVQESAWGIKYAVLREIDIGNIVLTFAVLSDVNSTVYIMLSYWNTGQI
jgi:hypothetical protein